MTTKQRKAKYDGIYFNPKRKAGSCYFTAVELPSSPEGKRRREWVYGPDAATVKERADKIREDVKRRRGEYLVDGSMTVSDLLTLFLEECVSREDSPITENTKANYEYAIGLINDRIGRELAQDLQAIQVKKLLLEPLAKPWVTKKGKQMKGRSPRTRQLVWMVLRAAYTWAAENNMPLGRPCNDTNAIHVENEEIDPLSKEEAAKFLKAVQGERLFTMMVLAIYAGLRLGELLALQWEDVNMETGELRIRHSLAEIGGRLITTPCNRCVNRQKRTGCGATDGRCAVKSRTSRRKLLLPPEAIVALRQHRERLEAEGLQPIAGRVGVVNAGRKACPWVFPTSEGTPQYRASARRWFKRVLRESGVRAIRFHDLRHTAATLMLTEGMDQRDIQRTLGHSDDVMTRRYQHWNDERMRKAAAVMTGLFAKEVLGGVSGR